MLIEKKKTAELLPAEYNPRKDLKPGDEEYEKLKRSIEEFGYVEPVIWNKTPVVLSAATRGSRSSSTLASPRLTVWSLKWTRPRRRLSTSL